MYIDANLEICTEDDVFGSSTTIYGENDIDFGGVRAGSHDQLWVTIDVTTSFASGTSAEFQFVTDSALPIDGSSIVLWSSGAIPIATLVAGYRVARFKVPVGLLRYASLAVVNVGANDAGAVNCFISESIDDAEFRS